MVGLAGMLGLAGLAGLPAQASAAVLPARSSSAFADSVGVNVHMSYSDKAYSNAPRVLRSLRRLGIRHVRDGLSPERPDQYAALRLLAGAGIRSTLIVGDPVGRFGTINELMPVIRGQLRGAVEALESVNEHDRTGRADWPGEVRTHQRRLAARAPRRLLVLGPTLSRNSSFVRLGRLRARDVDRGNIHPYPDGDRPDRPGFVEEQLRLGARISGRKAQWATETGYHNGVGEQPGVSERAAAIYMPRLLLTNFADGIRRTYMYELLDQAEQASDRAQDNRFGLLRSSFREKPAARAVRRLLALFGRSRGRCRGSVRVRISGLRFDLQTLAFRRCDGTSLVVLWRRAKIYDATVGGDLRGRVRRITLRFNRPVVGARLHSPTSGARTPRLRAGRSFTIAVGPAVRVLVVPPARRHR